MSCLSSEIYNVLVGRCGRDFEWEELWELVFDDVWDRCDALETIVGEAIYEWEEFGQ